MNNLIATTATIRTSSNPDVTQTEDFEAFYLDFESKLKDLQASMASTRSTRDLASSLAKRGTASMLLGTFTGRNDKDLASMVKELGISLETTQLVLQLVMKAQHAKNHFLRAFHSALVKQITAIQNDANILDSNQRDAAVVIIAEIRDHIATQLHQQELVEIHQERLHELETVLDDKGHLDFQQNQKLAALESSAINFLEADRAQQNLITQLQSEHASKDELDRVQTHRIDLLTSEIARLEMDGQRQANSLATAENQIAIATARIEALEHSAARHKEIRSLIARQALAFVALVAAITALLNSQYWGVG